MKRDFNFIKTRLKRLKETAKELKGIFRKTKNPALEDLYLEIESYLDEINARLKKIERGENGKRNKRQIQES